MNYFAYACAIVFLVLFILARRKASGAEHTLTHLKKDIDELLKRAEANQNKEIQHLLDALPHPFFSIDGKGIIARCNNPAKQLFGTREILNRPVRQVFLDSQIISSLIRVLDSPEVYREKLRLPPTSAFSSKYVDKDSFWVMDLRPTSLGSDDIEFQLIMRDITPGVQSDQVRQDFVANASHELRTPLSIISGYLENLTEEGGLDDHAIAAKMLDTMVRHVTRINRIVEDMLVISRLESDDAAPLKLAPFRFTHCVQDIVERLDLVIAKQGARIVVDVPDIEVVGDQFYWTQILFNLVENALKQNPSIPLKVKIKASQDKDRNLTVRISDNGIGIPARDLPFIFKRFYRVAKHHSQTQIKGTGLGLSIVMRAVEAHKGKISASSTPGVKTTFTIETPPLKAS